MEFFKNAQIFCDYGVESDKNYYLCTHISNLTMEQVKQLVETITKGIQEKKGKGIVVADLSGIDGTICHYFVICQGNSPSQVEAIAESVGDFARKEQKARPSAVDGTRNNLWVAIDYIDVVVHIFVPDAREFYDVDNLWEDAEITDIPDID